MIEDGKQETDSELSDNDGEGEDADIKFGEEFKVATILDESAREFLAEEVELDQVKLKLD